MENLRFELKEKINQFIDLIDDKYCDGCPFLEVIDSYKGITAANIDPWRDRYKCKCTHFNLMWLHSGRKNVPRCLECLVTDSKYRQ